MHAELEVYANNWEGYERPLGCAAKARWESEKGCRKGCAIRMTQGCQLGHPTKHPLDSDKLQQPQRGSAPSGKHCTAVHY